MEAQAEVVRAAAALTGELPVPTERCLLRAVREGDVADLQDYLGMPAVTQFLGHPALDLEQTADLLAQWLRDREAVTVVVEQDGHVVGDVRLRLRRRSAMGPASTSGVEAALGYAFHPRVQGQGLAAECVGAVLERAFRVAGVRRITARVFAPAVRSSRLLARLGFIRDGIDRSAVLAPDGSAWWDDELWSLLPGERVR
ncbi:GNAT family N-acetyltransferase [Ornithinimicrobium cryptoxanthini]|uniref:GNAT family N-acetyltransferase n=1 Tax=Ornithinimicrobium cryptoxanthini TaxID=2934161 RepID=UPI0021187E64|nr:GNAT family protein [Ornithinimicrobium cryptoxanthini]